MKKNIIKIAILGLATVFVVSGCKKSFLDQEIPGRLNENEFYKSDADADQAVIGAYDIMQSDYWNGSWTSTLMLKIMPSDDSGAGGGDANDQVGYQDLDKFNTNSQNDKVAGAWQKCYVAIYRANKIINLVAPENDFRKRIIAEAKFIRAYNYFELASMWGDVPIVLDIIEPGNYGSVGRSSQADVYKQIENDLKDAIAVLPLKSAYTKADRFRASKGAAQSMLGKLYLYQKNWGEAVKQFNLVINSKEYDLGESIAAVFAKSGQFGKESIFEIPYTSTQSYAGNFPWNGTPESNIHIQLWGPRGDNAYVRAPADSLMAGWGMNLPKKKLYDAYVTAGDVTRRKQSVMTLQELRDAGGDFNPAKAHDFDGVFQRKYGSFSTQSSSAGGANPELNYGTHWRFIRYADVILMAAEANYRNSGEPIALTLLNELRAKRDMPQLVGLSGDPLFKAIVLERRLELAFEGFRWLDLVRWDLADQELKSYGFVKGKHELLPIPYNDVVTAKLKQNPGY